MYLYTNEFLVGSYTHTHPMVRGDGSTEVRVLPTLPTTSLTRGPRPDKPS